MSVLCVPKSRASWFYFTSLLLLLMACLVGASPASAATASELLEKAIYAEETVGNLDEAIDLYQQVIEQGKAARQSSAQAQYRLGLCYQKQGKADAATAAFQAVIDDFPQETELVAEAKKHLPSALQLQPYPWAEGDELQLNMKLATGMDIGTMIYMVEAANYDDKDAWRCSSRGLVLTGANSRSEVLCDKQSFAPYRSLWQHDMLGEAHAVYKEGSVEITTAGKDKPTVIKTTSPPTWDNEQAAELFRLLPLKEGYKSSMSVVSSLGGGEVKIGLEVTGKETIDVPAGKFECYKLQLNIGQTFWITADDHRYIARFTAGGVTADLARAGKRTDEPQPLDAELFTVTLPAGWHSYMPTIKNGDDQKQATFLLDPLSVCDAEVTVGPKAKLNDKEQSSAQAWTDSYVANAAKRLKDFKVVESAADGLQIVGRDVAILEADFTDDGKPMKILAAAEFGGQSAANIRFTVPADKVDEFRPAFVEIVNSFKLK